MLPVRSYKANRLATKKATRMTSRCSYLSLAQEYHPIQSQVMVAPMSMTWTRPARASIASHRATMHLHPFFVRKKLSTTRQHCWKYRMMTDAWSSRYNSHCARRKKSSKRRLNASRQLHATSSCSRKSPPNNNLTSVPVCSSASKPA